MHECGRETLSACSMSSLCVMLDARGHICGNAAMNIIRQYVCVEVTVAISSKTDLLEDCQPLVERRIHMSVNIISLDYYPQSRGCQK